MRENKLLRLLRWASWLAILGLASMTWSVLDLGPISVVLAMTAGQILGTTSLVLFVVVVLRDLRRNGDRR